MKMLMTMRTKKRGTTITNLAANPACDSNLSLAVWLRCKPAAVLLRGLAVPVLRPRMRSKFSDSQPPSHTNQPIDPRLRGMSLSLKILGEALRFSCPDACLQRACDDALCRPRLISSLRQLWSVCFGSRLLVRSNLSSGIMNLFKDAALSTAIASVCKLALSVPFTDSLVCYLPPPRSVTLLFCDVDCAWPLSLSDVRQLCSELLLVCGHPAARPRRSDAVPQIASIFHIDLLPLQSL